MKLKSPYLIKPHAKVKLSRYKTAETDGFKSEQSAAAVLTSHRSKLAGLQEVFYADQSHSLLIVLQGMDTSGKDGTISHIFSGINPQGCDVTSFKFPTPLELRHDFLWRAHTAVPPRGQIGIFNRSHYEDVLAPRVHKTINARTVRAHLEDIVEFENTLNDNGTLILKFFLHISREEQTRRLQSRIDDPGKHWKLAQSDFKERLFWSDYTLAYQDLLSATSRKHAPWFVIPSDNKWYRNLVISGIILDAMKSLKLKYPPPTIDISKLQL